MNKKSARSATEVDFFLGENLKKIRVSKGLTREDLAGQLELSVHQIHKYESGKNRISVSRLIQFSNALKVPAATFLDEGEHFSPEVLELIDIYERLSNPLTKKRLIQIVTEMAETPN